MKQLLLGVVLATSLISGCGLVKEAYDETVADFKTEEAPIIVKTELVDNPNYDVYSTAGGPQFLNGVTIQAIAEDVSFNEIVVNRGHCKSADISYGIDLTYSETATVVISCSIGEVLEVMVKTNHGDFIFNWNQTI